MSGYTLYSSPSLQELLKEHSRLFVPRDLFSDPVTVIVQNKNMSEWLKLRLADYNGIYTSLRIVFPEMAIREIMSLLEDDGNDTKIPLYMDSLKIVLYRKLEKLLSGDNPAAVFTGLKRYVSDYTAEQDQEAPSLFSQRLYGLADIISGLFYRYGMNSGELVRSWSSGENCPDIPPSLLEDERWQKALWQDLFGPDSPFIHVGEKMEQLMMREPVLPGDFGRIILFGSVFSGDTGLRFFHHLSRCVTVDHLLFLPSEHYRESSLSPENLILNRWGTLIQGLSSRSREWTSGSGKSLPGQTPGFLEENRLLNRVQNAVWQNRSLDSGKGADGSLQIINCPGPWRMVETLRDRILDQLTADPRLRLTDIAVMAPDINDYASYIDAVFSEIPHNIIDLKRGDETPVLQAVRALLELPGSRFGRESIFRILENPVFMNGAGLREIDISYSREAAEFLNIRWGFNQAHRTDLGLEKGLPEDVNTWEEGFRRLFHSCVWGGDGVHTGDWDRSSRQILGLWAEIVRGLFHDFYPLKRMTLTFSQWIKQLESLFETYIVPREQDQDDLRDFRRVKGVFRDLNNLNNELYGSEEESPRFSFVFFRNLFIELLGKSEGSRGRYLTQGITCSSLRPMRAIPFKVVFILGLDGGVFPRKETPVGFDLTEYLNLKIRVDREGNDRYTLLETLFSAREKLILFYNGKDNRTGNQLAPSPLVRELKEFLKQGGVDPEAIEHSIPLSFYDERLFQGGSGGSYDAEAYQLACTFREGLSVSPAKSLVFKRKDLSPDTVSVRQLGAFIKNPVEHYFTRALNQKSLWLGEEAPEWINRDLDAPLRKGLLDNLFKGEGEQIPEQYYHFLTQQGDIVSSPLDIRHIDLLKHMEKGFVDILEQEGIPRKDPPLRYLLTGRKKDLPSRYRCLLTDRWPRLKGDLLPVFETGEQRIYFTVNKGKAGSLRNDIAPFVSALISSVLGEIKQSWSIQAAYDPVKDKFSLRKTLFSLDNAREDLQFLLKSFDEAGEAPLYLYPSVAEQLLKEGMADSDRDFSNSLSRIWVKQVNDSITPWIDVRDCRYRSLYLKELPDFFSEAQRIREILQRIYGRMHVQS